MASRDGLLGGSSHRTSPGAVEYFDIGDSFDLRAWAARARAPALALVVLGLVAFAGRAARTSSPDSPPEPWRRPAQPGAGAWAPARADLPALRRGQPADRALAAASLELETWLEPQRYYRGLMRREGQARGELELALQDLGAEGGLGSFSDHAVIDFHNAADGSHDTWRGSGAGARLLERSAQLGCASLPRNITAKQADEGLRSVSVSWRYSGWVANFCGPSTEQIHFDGDGKISRLVAFVDWRVPRQNATRQAFDRFESMLHVWRNNASEAAALKELFAENVRVTFWNDATKERRLFYGRSGAAELLLYAGSLSCALLPDEVQLDQVDEESRMVYMTWDYPSERGGPSLCGGSGEIYEFDRDFKIFRLDALVKWAR